MKKLLLALCLAATCTQQVSAQGFFKKLGKILTESAKDAVSDGTSTQSTKWGNITIKNQFPNLDVSVQHVSHKGNDAIVTLLFTNKSSNGIRVYGLRARKAFDSEGNEYSSRCQVGKEVMTIGDAYHDFEPDVPTKVFFLVSNVPTKAFCLRMLKFETNYYQDGTNQNIDAPIELRNINVPEQEKVVAQTNNSAANTGVFKGEWMSNDGAYYINIDLYQKKKWEGDDNPSYGGLGMANIQYVDQHEITKVLSINGNTATIVSVCDYGGATWKGKLTYNPTTKKMAYTQLERLDHDEDNSDYCMADSFQLPKAK